MFDFPSFDFAAHPVLLGWLVILNVPAHVVVAWGIFGSWEDFLGNLRYGFQPGWLSILRGE